MWTPPPLCPPDVHLMGHSCDVFPHFSMLYRLMYYTYTEHKLNKTNTIKYWRPGNKANVMFTDSDKCRWTNQLVLPEVIWLIRPLSTVSKPSYIMANVEQS